MKSPEDIIKAQQKQINELKMSVNTLSKQLKVISAGLARVQSQARNTQGELASLQRTLRL